MQPTLYIHLGQQKTGTSSFQRFCTRYRHEILDQCGILYPEPPAGPAHRHVAFFPFKAPLWHKLRADVDALGCNKIVLSNEDLSEKGLAERDFQAIREVFDGFRIVLILYVRRVDDACREWYMQCVKRDRMLQTPYAAYVRNLHAQKAFRLYPSRLLLQCREMAGADNLQVRVYDRALLRNNNIVDDLFVLLGATLPDSLDRSRQYNQGIPDRALPCLTETLRAYELDSPVRKEVYQKIIEAFQERSEDQPGDGFFPELEQEIALMDAEFLPGYKALFDKKPLDLSFARSAASPYELLMLDLMYSILFELRKKQTRWFRIKKWFDASIRPAFGQLSAKIKRFVRPQ